MRLGVGSWAASDDKAYAGEPEDPANFFKRSAGAIAVKAEKIYNYGRSESIRRTARWADCKRS